MGIQARLQVINYLIEILCKNANKATEKRLQSEYERLVNSKEMGQNFKFMCIQQWKNGSIFPFIEDS